jgi:signal transduction histidine kinase/ActR/RegA family two-component response regulator
MDALKQICEATSEQRPTFLEVLCPRTKAWYTISAFPSSQGLAVFLRDITEHKHALEARRLMEEQLHQSQKMESVGQLTGGVAHDFNNLLMVISANLELIEAAAGTNKVRRCTAAARRAADRGAKLTAQLLAFSRRQALKPKLVNANQLISEFQGLIHQAVGDGCKVKLQTDEELWFCHVDPALLETALLNLALNARDAMADGGELRIETQNIVEEESVAGCSPGPYVRLSVADNGSGMPPEVRDRVFEPFFTTKEVGKGTGLGLSMVYGFVKQSGGDIHISSRVGEGTTVCLYLPRALETQTAQPEADTPGVQRSLDETILVVEDDEDVRQFAVDCLVELGYKVLEATSGPRALSLLKQRPGEVQLLVTDVVMPDLSGRQLAEAAHEIEPNLPVLYVSGYPRDVILQDGRVKDGVELLSKPFTQQALAAKVRELLDQIAADEL